MLARDKPQNLDAPPSTQNALSDYPALTREEERLVRRAEGLLPAPSKFIRIAGYRMHYLDEGEGPVVLLLHGNPTWCFFYRELFSRLRENYRVIALDHLGCGLSSNPTDACFRATDRADHVAEFVDALGIERLSLVMHDWGGSIGTLFAVHRPEQIEKLVYFNTTLTETESLPFVIRRAAHGRIGRFLTQGSKRFVKLTTSVGVGKKLPRAIRKAYELPYQSKLRRKAIWEFVQDIPFDDRHPSHHSMRELAKGLPSLQSKPVQIIWGLRDICFHRGMLTKICRQFPKADVYEIPEASHLVLEDEPEFVCGKVESFLGDSELPLDSTKEPTLEGSAEPVSFRGFERSVHPLFAKFEKIANDHPTTLAVSEVLFIGDAPKYSQVNYSKLHSRVNQYRRGLRKLGLVAGDRVLMLVSPGSEFLALSYAVMGEGAVPCFVDPGIGIKKLRKCIEDLSPHAFIGSPKAQILKFIPGVIPKGLKFTLTASDWIPLWGKTLSYLRRFAERQEAPFRNFGTGLIAFTSGATGTPKGVVFSNEMLEAQTEIFARDFHLRHGKRDLPLLPVFSLYHLALGVGSVFAPLDPSRPLDLEPERILRILEDQGVTNSFGSPALWNKICDYAERTGKRLETLERIFMAGAPVPLELVKRLSRVTNEGCECFTPYGATEALPVTLLSGQQLRDGDTLVTAVDGEQGQFVGQALEGLTLRVCSVEEGDSGEPIGLTDLDARQIGEVVVSGRNVSPEYFQRVEATRQSKFRDDSGTLWHRMGDLGYLDHEGSLYFCGRKVHAVPAEERLLYSVPVERVFNTLPKVRRSALVDLGNGNGPAIVIEPHAQHWPRNQREIGLFVHELKDCGSKVSFCADLQNFFFFKNFPVDPRHNAKIYRGELSAWAREKFADGEVL